MKKNMNKTGNLIIANAIMGANMSLEECKLMQAILGSEKTAR